MPQRSSYPPGTFSWIDLATTDAEGAKAFYGGLFGWDYDDRPMGDGTNYSMAQIGGASVAAIVEQDTGDAPPHWNSYITVEDVDATAARVGGLGGTLVGGPFDVFDAGRMAVISDPTGAFVELWQAKDNIGAGVVNAHGALSWNDLSTNDADTARSFYSELLGWTYEQVSEVPPYWVIQNGERSNGGVRVFTEEEANFPPHWLPYFGADSTDDTASAAADAGGSVLVAAFDLPSGRVAVLGDPQGAAFAVFQGDFDD
jgi:predicted enzyme related to lactoylglutathione lyase